MAAVRPPYPVVRPHDTPGAALLHAGFKSRQVDFMQCPVAQRHIHPMAPRFLVVQRIMLDTGRYAVALKPLNIRHSHPRSQQGVFAHVFEIPSVQRRPVNIHARPQQHILVAVTGLFADGNPVRVGQFGIEGSRKTRQGRKCRTVIARPAGIVEIAPVDLGAHPVRAVAHPQLRNAEAGNSGRTEHGLRMHHGDFLLQRHPSQNRLHTFFRLPDAVDGQHPGSPGGNHGPKPGQRQNDSFHISSILRRSSFQVRSRFSGSSPHISDPGRSSRV